MLETKEINGVLLVSFKDRARQNVNGIAILNKGINQRYRIIQASIRTTESSSVLQHYHIDIKNKPYYVISGYNLSDEIKYYGLDYYGYLNPESLVKDRVKKSIKFSIANQQFMDIYVDEDIDSLFEKSVDTTLYNVHLRSTSMYNADGEEITDKFIIENESNSPKGTIGKAELFLINVFIVIVLGLGFIMTRYFLT